MSEVVLRRVGAGQVASNPTETKVLYTGAGAVVAGLLGAILGAAGDHMGLGAAVGVAAGAAGGYLIGKSKAAT